MKKNDIVEIEITALSSECSGIGKKDGMVIFVPFSAIGDKLEVKILKVNKTYCYGKIERIITPSPDRVTPDCPVYTRCGGCSLRHISYEAQLRAKEQFVKDAFTRIGGLSPEFLPIIRNTNINGYRNKLQIPIGTDKDGNLIAGFYAFHSHRIVPCEQCLLQPDIFSKITADFLEISTGLDLTAYDEITHKGILRHLYLRKGYYSGEICLCIVVAKNVPEIKILSDRLLEKYPEIVSSVINVNNRDTNVILGDEEIVLTSKNYICDIMCKNAVNIAPKAFYQVNTPCAEQLYSSACDFAEPKGKTVLDLYCGAGTIGLSMARTAKKIIGVEIVPEAIENAKQNALANGITNCEFICADATEAARILHSRSLRPDVIMVDPPRKGCGRDACEQIAAFSAPRIVMVSCNAATAARDCACFAELGYSTDKCVAVDMFSGTNHVETVVLLSKGEIDSKKVRVEFSLEDMDMSGFQKGATYEQIKAYVLEHTGLKVSSLYISQIKRKCGLDVGQNYNLSKKEDAKVPKCPPEKEAAIRDALKYFQMI
jgi:23S rRNA (uracil-5-)-methyltransferase rumA